MDLLLWDWHFDDLWCLKWPIDCGDSILNKSLSLDVLDLSNIASIHSSLLNGFNRFDLGSLSLIVCIRAEINIVEGSIDNVVNFDSL